MRKLVIRCDYGNLDLLWGGGGGGGGVSPGSRNLLWGGRFTRGAAMYAKLFERRRGVQSAYDGGGGGAVGKLH